MLFSIVILFCTISTITADGYPTVKPTWRPTQDPTWEPTPRPTYKDAPTRYPTPAPSPRPSPVPTPFPTLHGGVHSSKEPTPSPTMGMASYAMHYKLFNQEVTLADMMAIAVTIWGAIFVFALRHHYRSSGTSDTVGAIRLDDISAHSEMSDTSHTPALKESNTLPPAAPFTLKKHNVFNLSGSASIEMSDRSRVSNKDVVAAAVASALHMPMGPAFSDSDVVMDMDSAPLPKPDDEEDGLRL